MRLARELEQRLERLVEGATAAVFRGRLHPIDLADRMIRQLEFLKAESFSGPRVPNRLTLQINSTDLDESIDRGDLGAELATIANITATDRGWRVEGPFSVEVVATPSVPKGLVECAGTIVTGPLPAWGQLIALGGGGAHELRHNRVMVGRAAECDVMIAVPEVSRQHAVLARTAGEVVVADLGSSNGTTINSTTVMDRPVHVVPGDELAFGDRTFSFRTL